MNKKKRVINSVRIKEMRDEQKEKYVRKDREKATAGNRNATRKNEKNFKEEVEKE